MIISYWSLWAKDNVFGRYSGYVSYDYLKMLVINIKISTIKFKFESNIGNYK